MKKLIPMFLVLAMLLSGCCLLRTNKVKLPDVEAPRYEDAEPAEDYEEIPEYQL